MAEILLTLSVLKEPARIFFKKMCSFDVTDFEKTLLVTLYKCIMCKMLDVKLSSLNFYFVYHKITENKPE